MANNSGGLGPALGPGELALREHADEQRPACEIGKYLRLDRAERAAWLDHMRRDEGANPPQDGRPGRLRREPVRVCEAHL